MGMISVQLPLHREATAAGLLYFVEQNAAQVAVLSSVHWPLSPPLLQPLVMPSLTPCVQLSMHAR